MCFNLPCNTVCFVSFTRKRAEYCYTFSQILKTKTRNDLPFAMKSVQHKFIANKTMLTKFSNSINNHYTAWAFADQHDYNM